MENVLNLHDLAKATLAHDFEELEILDLERTFTIFDEANTHLDATGAKGYGEPFIAGLTTTRCPILLGGLGGDLFETRSHLARTEKDVIAAACAGARLRVAEVELDGDLGGA